MGGGGQEGRSCRGRGSRGRGGRRGSEEGSEQFQCRGSERWQQQGLSVPPSFQLHAPPKPTPLIFLYLACFVALRRHRCCAEMFLLPRI